MSPIKKVPQTLKEAKKLIEKAPELTFETVCEGYSGHWHETTYGNINKRWLLLRSEQATKREILNLDKRMLKQSEKARKDFKKLKTQEFACLEGAQKAVVQWKKDFDF